jgi:GNAT superfamily N-acetyltransferase
MRTNEPKLGHSVTLVGYDDTKKRFVFRNSWGTNWGDAGYGYLPYEYLERYQQEAWVLTLSTVDPILGGDRGIVERVWGVPDPLGNIQHGIEFVDYGSGEVIGWSFMLENDRGLEMEELFVRPMWRGRGFGRAMAARMCRLADSKGAKLTALIPHADVIAALPATERTLVSAGLRIRAAQEQWCGALAD